MKSRTHSPITAAIALILGIAGLVVPAVSGGAVEVGQPAPAFTLQDHLGNSHSLAGYAGKVVVLFFVGYG